MSKLLKVGIGAVVLLIAAGAAGWFFLLRDDAPEEASLRERDPVATTTAAPGGPTTTADDFELPGEDAADAGTDVVVIDRPDSGGDESPDGVWAVAPDDTGEVFVGYRMQEVFGGEAIKKTAVGRTLAVSGTMTIEGTTVTGVEIVADLSALESNRARRDSFLHTDALETDDFPTATFQITDPFDLDEVPGSGEAIEVMVSGTLTLHGVTRDVEVPLTARWSGGFIDLSGSLEIHLADYDIERPDVAGLVSVEDDGLMELQLSFERS